VWVLSNVGEIVARYEALELMVDRRMLDERGFWSLEDSVDGLNEGGLFRGVSDGGTD